MASDNRLNSDQVKESLRMAEEAAKCEPDNRKHQREITFWRALGTDQGIFDAAE